MSIYKRKRDAEKITKEIKSLEKFININDEYSHSSHVREKYWYMMGRRTGLFDARDMIEGYFEGYEVICK